MDFIKSQYDRISQQLAGLTPSQKMLSASLVVIMVMTLFWWGRFAGTPEQVAILDQSLTTDDISRIKVQLDANGVNCEVRGDRIFVPSDRKHQAIAAITLANVLPTSIVSGFDEAIKQLTAWDGQDRQNAVFNHGKERELQNVISNFPGVTSATVIIDPSSKARIGRPIDPTASVDVTTKGEGSSFKQMAAACTLLVSRSQAGLKPENVAVIINGKPMPAISAASAAEGVAASDLLEMQTAAETRETKKLQDHLQGFIPGVRVLVTCQVNASTKAVQRSEVHKEKSGVFELENTNKTREETTTRAVANEAAVVPNLGLAIGSSGGNAGGPLHNSTETLETVKNTIVPAITNSQEMTQAGQHSIASASVRVPLSYFVNKAKRGNPAAKEPDDVELGKIIAVELPEIQKDVAACTRITQPELITVATYTDSILSPVSDTKIAAASGVGTLLTGHVKEIALGGLALVSLFMMSMIVRKGAVPAVAVAVSTARPSQPNFISGAESFAGEVSEHSPAMDGMELDDDSIKTQQMLSQVSSMVGENPETAAQLIKRWMNQR